MRLRNDSPVDGSAVSEYLSNSPGKALLKPATRLLFTGAVLTLYGCTAINPGTVTTAVDKNNCAVRYVAIQADASAMNYAEVNARGYQLTLLNPALCAGMEVKFPMPNDSSKTIDIKVPGNTLAPVNPNL